MKRYKVRIIEQNEQVIFGLSTESSDQSQIRDIPALSRRFYARFIGKVLPFYVVSRDYDPLTKRFTLFVGGKLRLYNKDLQQMILPAGSYGKIEVRPKFGFLWGPAIGEAKQWFYTRWLPKTGWEPVNLEYELHTARSTGKQPTVAILFAIRPKASKSNNSNAL